MDKLKEQIKAEKDFIKKGRDILKTETFSDDDRKFFSDAKKANQTAEAIADTEEKMTLLLVQYAQIRNKMVFLLFRKNALTPELEKNFRSLPSIEDVAEMYKEFEKQHTAEREEIQKLIDKDREKEHKLDIFKGVLNGMSVEQAEEQLKKYESQVKQAVQGKNGA